MIYSFSANNRGSKFLNIEFTIENNKDSEVFVQLPAWRPGRYELGNFAKNIQKFEVKTMNNKSINFEKVTKDKWLIQAGKYRKFKICYNYYANELNAGSTWIDENQTYVNPVNCCLYVEGRENEQVKLFLNKLGHSQAAISLQKTRDYYLADSFDELADSPFILSDSLQHHSYNVQGTKFNIWFQGECRPPWKKIIKDFKAFTNEQHKLFGSFPFDEYHFLYQILPYQSYHGVEHLKSTVISFGPGYSVFEGENYEEFLGVSSHELFHAWNVKTIRPADMFPYNFTKENYTKMGYLTEGVTTYYGDLMLKNSGVFSTNQFLKQINKTLDRHFLNYGTKNMSVANSSFDTWIDGYVRGIPNRKSSIYTEGCLLSMITDLTIRAKTASKKSLNDVLKKLYNSYAKKGKGITEVDFKKEIEKVAGSKLNELWNNYFYGTNDFYPLLKETLQEFGLKITKSDNPKKLASNYGAFTQLGNSKISLIAPNSPACIAGLNVGDEIIAINGIQVQKDNANQWAKYFGKNLELVVKKDGLLKTFKLAASSKSFFPKVKLVLHKSNSELKNWLN